MSACEADTPFPIKKMKNTVWHATESGGFRYYM